MPTPSGGSLGYKDMEQWRPSVDFWQQATAYIENIMRALEFGASIDWVVIDKIQMAKSEALGLLPATEGQERAELNRIIGLIESTEDLLKAGRYI